MQCIVMMFQDAAAPSRSGGHVWCIQAGRGTGCGVKAGMPSWGWGCVLLLSPLWRRMHSALPCTPRHHHLTTHYSAEGHMHNTTARLLPAEEVKYRVTSQHDSKLIWFGKGSTTFYATHILLILPEVQDGI